MYPGHGRSSERGYKPQNAGTETTASRRLTAWSRRLLPYIPRSLPDNRVILKQETRHSFTLVEWILDRRLLDGRLGSTPWMGLWMQDDLPMWWSKYISMCWWLLIAALVLRWKRPWERTRQGRCRSIRICLHRQRPRKDNDFYDCYGAGSGCVSGCDDLARPRRPGISIPQVSPPGACHWSSCSEQTVAHRRPQVLRPVSEDPDGDN